MGAVGNGRRAVRSGPLVAFPGVALFVCLLEVEDGQPGVVFERLNRGVAEQLLDVIRVCAGTYQFGGAGPAEGVGGDMLLEAVPADKTYDKPAA